MKQIYFIPNLTEASLKIWTGQQFMKVICIYHSHLLVMTQISKDIITYPVNNELTVNPLPPTPAVDL